VTGNRFSRSRYSLNFICPFNETFDIRSLRRKINWTSTLLCIFDCLQCHIEFRQYTRNNVDSRYSSTKYQLFVNTNTLNGNFSKRIQNGGWSRAVCKEILAKKWQNLRADTDCTEWYFENKDIEISYLNEIWGAYWNEVRETFHGSPEQTRLSIQYFSPLKTWHIFFNVNADI